MNTNLPPDPAYKPSTSLNAHGVTGNLDVRAATERTGLEPSCDVLASDERGTEII